MHVSASSTLQQRTLQGAAETQGYALSVGKERKMAGHAASCRAVGISFIPLVVESLGGCSELAAETLRRVGCLLGQRLGISPSITTSFRGAQCPSGEEMLHYGYTVFLPSLLLLLVSSDWPCFVLFLCVCVCVCVCVVFLWLFCLLHFIWFLVVHIVFCIVYIVLYIVL